MYDIIFENSKGLGGTVNRKSGYAEATKKFFERNFPKFTRKFPFLIFFDKVRRCISASSLETTLQWRCFL